MNSATLRNVALVFAAWVTLGVLRYKPWQRVDADERRHRLAVGFLPVT